MSGHVIFKDGKIVSGNLTYDDVQRYLPALEQFRSQGQHDMADSILNTMPETGQPATTMP